MTLNVAQQPGTEGHDDLRYWLGDVRLLHHHLNTGVDDPALLRLIAAAKEKHPVDVEVLISNHPMGQDFTVVVWALPTPGLEKKLIWGSPTFRSYEEAMPLQDELKLLVEAVTKRMAPAAAEAPQSKPRTPTVEQGAAWLPRLEDLERIVDLVKAKHHLKAEFDGDSKSGYSVQIRDFTAEWKSLPGATGYEAVVWATQWFDSANDADSVFDMVHRLLSKLQELRDSSPALTLVKSKEPR